MSLLSKLVGIERLYVLYSDINELLLFFVNMQLRSSTVNHNNWKRIDVCLMETKQWSD